jgi:hypothetical protein
MSSTLNPWRSISLTADAISWRRCFGVALLYLTSLLSLATHADPLLDFKLFNATDPSMRKINLPTVKWIVHPEAETYCQQAQPKDGFVSRTEGCVYWQVATSRCTLVTRPSTTHSQLGHLLLHCMEGK